MLKLKLKGVGVLLIGKSYFPPHFIPEPRFSFPASQFFVSAHHLSKFSTPFFHFRHTPSHFQLSYLSSQAYPISHSAHRSSASSIPCFTFSIPLFSHGIALQFIKHTTFSFQHTLLFAKAYPVLPPAVVAF